MKEQEIISAQQELKHLRTRCGKGVRAGQQPIPSGGADHAGS